MRHGSVCHPQAALKYKAVRTPTTKVCLGNILKHAINIPGMCKTAMALNMPKFLKRLLGFAEQWEAMQTGGLHVFPKQAAHSLAADAGLHPTSIE